MDGWGVLAMIASSIIDQLEVRWEVRPLWRRLRGDTRKLWEGVERVMTMSGVPVENKGSISVGALAFWDIRH
jgi:hypothetical protein